MEDKEEPREDSAYLRALRSFEDEKLWYERERELLDRIKEDHQSKWKAFVQRFGRL